MLKAAVITWHIPVEEEPYRGHSVYQTLLRLKELMQIEVFCTQPKYPLFFRPRSFQHWSTNPQYQPPDLPTRYVQYPVFPILSRPVNGMVCAHWVEPLVRAARPNVILNYKLYPDGYAAVRIGERLGIPVIVKAVGSDLHRISDPFTKILTAQTLKRATLVLTVSQDLRHRAMQLGANPAKVISIPNGCDTSIFCPRPRHEARAELGIPPHTKLVLYVGRLDFRKGLRELLRAFRSMKVMDPRKLTIIGEGPARCELDELSRALGCREDVLFIPPSSSMDIARWMAAADVCCLPSYAEGCPNVVIEALSSGRPVVGSSVGGIPELIHPSTGILVPPRNSEKLAIALQDALKYQWDANKISASASRGWDDVAREVHRLCELVTSCTTREAIPDGKSDLC